MKKLTILAILVAALFLMTGCSGSKETANKAEQAEQAAPTTEAAPSEAAPAETMPAESTPAESMPGEAVATHDCAAGCGMTNVPEDQMTEIDGKWYCAHCAKKMQEQAGKEG